jgi:hypothetical protein
METEVAQGQDLAFLVRFNSCFLLIDEVLSIYIADLLHDSN